MQWRIKQSSTRRFVLRAKGFDMETYDNFGKFYDAVMGQRTATADRLRKMIAQNKADARTVLELGCGTGAVFAHLAQEYEVSGLDLSLGMLSVARKKLPDSSIFHQNMVNFNIGRKFDVILCFFDTINHLLNFADWESVFDQVDAHLEAGGLFIFDINTEYKLERLMKAPAFVEEFGKNVMIMDDTGEPEGGCTWNVKIFEDQEDSTYRLFEELIKEKSFPVERIRGRLLEKFKSIRIIDFKRRRPSGKSERLYFLCHKRNLA
jgi:SAM-dependent methyltransferase